MRPGTAGKKHQAAAKLAAAASRAHSTADQPPVHGSADSFPPAATAAAAAAATTTGASDATLPIHEPVHADSSSAAGQAMGKEPSVVAEGEAVTQQGQGGVIQTDSAVEEGSQSRSLELPLSILLTGEAPVKKRGRPYKNAANAEKAAQRDARKAAQEAAERAAYQAASEAAQVVIAAPPIKKRRGRPPKDPAKLAAALAAYHANAHARQASTEHQQGNAGFDTVMEAAQAAAAHASAAAAEPAHVSPSEADATLPSPVPRSGQKKRGRPPKNIAKAVGDNLQSPGASAANGNGYSAMRQDAIRGDADDNADDEDDDQALLDAAAVLTSDLPFPQGIRKQTLPFQQPKSRQPKGRHRSGNHAKPAVLSQPAAADRQRRRGLELVSSRATALLDSIGPDPNGPAQDQDLTPQPHPNLSPQKQGGPPAGSDLMVPAPSVAGRSSKRQRKHHHSSQQPATAAAGSTGSPPQATPSLAPSPPSPGLQTVPEAADDIACRDDSSAVAVPVPASSSLINDDAGGSPTPHAAMSPVRQAVGGLSTPHADPMSPIPYAAAGETTLNCTHSYEDCKCQQSQLPV